jgi:cytochrome c peroxidase
VVLTAASAAKLGADEDDVLLRKARRLIGSLPTEAPAPADNPLTPGKAALGKQLFFDPRLSAENSLSCASCHEPAKAFGDGLDRGRGRGGKFLSRNTPALLDLAFQAGFFWDGRAKSLEEQSLLPIQTADEMAQDLGELERELSAVPGYVAAFQSVFGTGVTRDGIAKSLAAFVRTLRSRESPFDRYLAGDGSALTDEAKHGLELFLGEAGCVRCHSGPALSDGRYYRLGVEFRDRGRGAVTRKKEDEGKFRTPALRNVARTGPYMHDGSLKALRDVVTFYYRNAPVVSPDGAPLDIEPLLGQSVEEIDAIVAFLESLTSELPEFAKPDLP